VQGATRLHPSLDQTSTWKVWVKQSNTNVVYLLYALKGEIYFIEKKLTKAKDNYANAISSSTRAGFKIDGTLTNEVFSYFYANPENELHGLAEAEVDMTRALDAYEAFGATIVVAHLRSQQLDLSH